jgi:hypothetical protein
MKPKMTQDEVLEVNLDQNLRQQAETKYQMAIREQRTDVDLDFDYQYN